VEPRASGYDVRWREIPSHVYHARRGADIRRIHISQILIFAGVLQAGGTRMIARARWNLGASGDANRYEYITNFFNTKPK